MFLRLRYSVGRSGISGRSSSFVVFLRGHKLNKQRRQLAAILPVVDSSPECFMTRVHLSMLHSDIFNISKAPELKQNLNFNRSLVCPVYFSPGAI